MTILGAGTGAAWVIQIVRGEWLSWTMSELRVLGASTVCAAEDCGSGSGRRAACARRRRPAPRRSAQVVCPERKKRLMPKVVCKREANYRPPD